MYRSMGYGERKATNKEYIIKPASTVGPWSLILQGNSVRNYAKWEPHNHPNPVCKGTGVFIH